MPSTGKPTAVQIATELSGRKQGGESLRKDKFNGKAEFVYGVFGNTKDLIDFIL